MHWPSCFEDRLRDWNLLRQECQDASIPDALLKINDWWMRAPLSTQHIAWEDWKEWPTPWDLLLDNTWCELTRGIGIVYTLGLVFGDDFETTYLVDSNEGILVVVGPDKYFLNYCFGDLDAIELDHLKTIRSINAKKLEHFRLN